MSDIPTDTESPEIEPLKRLTRDLKAATTTLSPHEVRFLVDAYYQMQEDRKRSVNQVRALSSSGEPHEVLTWLAANTATLERNIKTALDAYSTADFVGRWAKSITGIGPVIAAGLSAHIDITRAPTVGHIWRFAGLDPTVTWAKKTKRPWNASLKTLCWKIGESFVKVSNHDQDVYGHLWADRKLKEIARNDAGELADQAQHKLATCKIGKTTDAYTHYSAGKLPPAHIHARAKRWSVKLFLAHWHSVAYRHHHGEMAPKPYALTILGHGHEVPVPYWPF